MGGLTLEWTPGIALGIESIDSQHRELFGRVNALMAALSTGKGQEEVGKAIAFLRDYIVKHFTLEEAYMTRYNYPGLAVHKAQHAKFVDEFFALKKTYEAEGATVRVAMEVQKRVGDWLVTHILQSDKELADYLTGKI